MWRRLLELLGLRRRKPPLVPSGPVSPTSGTIADVLARMEALDAQLGPDDGVRWFNRLYLEVTRRVAGYDQGGPQASPGFLERLDLALGICSVCIERGVKPRERSPEHTDYQAVNPLIADAEKSVKGWLLTGAL